MTAMLENPISRERILVHAATRDLLRIEEQVPPDMIRPPIHVHPTSMSGSRSCTARRLCGSDETTTC